MNTCCRLRVVDGSDLKLLSLGQDKHLHKTSVTEFKGSTFKKKKQKKGRKKGRREEEGRGQSKHFKACNIFP